MSDVPFQDTTRIDAHDKVCGKALFGADDARPEMVHAALAVATIGKGRIVTAPRLRYQACGWSSRTRTSAM
jgi:xanthine dehydrogenase YagR molybdenum-binding subunit